MLVSGVTLKYAMNSQRKKNELLYSKFKKNIKRFPSSTSTDTLPGIHGLIEAGEARVARIQTFLTEYNMKVTFDFEGKPLTLLEAIRVVGAASRVEKMWRDTVQEKSGRYQHMESSRDKDHEYAVETLSEEEALGFHDAAERRAQKLRAQIEIANAYFVDISGVEEVLEEK